MLPSHKALAYDQMFGIVHYNANREARYWEFAELESQHIGGI
jgi:hypothetical protein